MEINYFFLIFRERKVKTRNDSDFSRSREAEISSASILFRFLPLDGDFYGAFFLFFFCAKKPSFPFIIFIKQSHRIMLMVFNIVKLKVRGR